MDSILSFLNDIPSVFIRDEGIKDLSHHSFKEKEEKNLQFNLCLFRIDGTKFCSDYRISYRTFNSWKESFKTELDVLSLLKCHIPPKDAKPIHSMSVECTPTVCSQSIQTDFTSSPENSFIFGGIVIRKIRFVYLLLWILLLLSWVLIILNLPPNYFWKRLFTTRSRWLLYRDNRNRSDHI
jgi:hypothetical protein